MIDLADLLLPECDEDECHGHRRCCLDRTHKPLRTHCYHWRDGLPCCQCGAEKPGEMDE